MENGRVSQKITQILDSLLKLSERRFQQNVEEKVIKNWEQDLGKFIFKQNWERRKNNKPCPLERHGQN